MLKDHLRGQFAHDKWSESRSDSNNAYHDAYSYLMPFGKHKGSPICSVPADYLAFIQRTTNNLDTASRCSDELERRKRIKA